MESTISLCRWRSLTQERQAFVRSPPVLHYNQSLFIARRVHSREFFKMEAKPYWINKARTMVFVMVALAVFLSLIAGEVL
jgi:hypothetical protein